MNLFKWLKEVKTLLTETRDELRKSNKGDSIHKNEYVV